VSRQQIEDLIEDVHFYHMVENTPINRIKIAGGEPLLHPDILWILERLSPLVPEYVLKIKLDSNGTMTAVIGDMMVNNAKVPNIVFSGRAPKKKMHLPYLWSPTDLGLKVTPCDTPRLCGFSLDNRGWLPCSPAIMIARTFGLDHLYMDGLPHSVWGMDELCKHCIHAAPKAFREAHCKPLREITEAERTPTESWRKALKHV
jgi:hypothetical protein